MNAKRTGHGLARSVVAVATACATVAGFVVPVQAAPSATGTATVTQTLPKDQQRRTAVAKEQTFTVTSILKWTNNSDKPAIPASLVQMTDPANGVVAEKVVFSSDKVDGAKLLKPGNHTAVEGKDGNSWAVAGDALVEVPSGEQASAFATVTYRITDLVAATEKGNRWCKGDTADESGHGLKTTGLIDGTESNTVCTGIKFPNLALKRTVEGGETKNTTVTIPEDRKNLDFTYTIENTGSSNLTGLQLSDRALVLGDGGKVTRGKHLNLDGITCTGKDKTGSKDLRLKVRLSDDKHTAHIDFTDQSVFAYEETVTCTLKNVPVSSLDFNEDAAAQLMVVNTAVESDEGQSLGQTYSSTERLASTLFRKDGAIRFETGLSAGANPTPRVLDGSPNQQFATTMTVSLKNPSPQNPHTPRGLTIDTSKIAEGLEVTSVTLSPNKNDPAAAHLVDQEIELEKSADGDTWFIAEGLKQISSKSTARATVTVKTTVKQMPDKENRTCDGTDGRGLRISADAEAGNQPSSACVGFLVPGATITREVSNARDNTYYAANDPDSPFKDLESGQKAWFKWTVTNTGETTLGSVYINDYVLKTIANEPDVAVKNLEPEGLTCDKGATAEKNGTGFKVTLTKTGLKAGGKITCTYTGGITPEWQGPRFETKSVAKITSHRDAQQLVSGELEPITAESIVYAKKEGPDVFVSGIVNAGANGTQDQPVVATHNGQQIAVTWLLNVRNWDNRLPHSSDDIHMTLSRFSGLELTDVKVKPGPEEGYSLIGKEDGYSLGKRYDPTILSEWMDEFALNSVRAAYVTAVYTVTDFNKLKNSKEKLSCSDSFGGLRLTAGEGNSECRSIAPASLNAQATIDNGKIRHTFETKEPGQITYFLQNNGTADLAAISLWDYNWAPKPNTKDEVLVGENRPKGDFTCTPADGVPTPEITQEKETDEDGKVTYKGILLKFPENKPLAAGQYIKCVRTVAYEELFPDSAAVYRIRFEAKGYPRISKMQQANGGTPANGVSSPGNDVLLFPVKKKPAPGGGTNTNPGTGGTRPSPGGGTLNPNPGDGKVDNPGGGKEDNGSSGGNNKDGGSSGGIGSIALGILPLLAILAGVAWLMMPKQGVGATLMYFPAEGRFHFV